jgi:hypothetical protein
LSKESERDNSSRPQLHHTRIIVRYDDSNPIRIMNMMAFLPFLLFILANISFFLVTHAMVVVVQDPIIRRQHIRNVQLCYSRAIRTCPSSVSDNASFCRRNNGKLSNSITLHLTQQQQQQQQIYNDDDDDGGIENAKEENRQQQQDRGGERITTCDEEDDDGGLFFLEASRQAARERKLQIVYASSSSSTFLSLGDERGDGVDVRSNIAGSIHDMKAPSIEVKFIEEGEEEVDADTDADADAEKYEFVVVEENEDEESRVGNKNDDGVTAVEAAPTMTENDETAILGNDDDILLQLLPPSQPSNTESRSIDVSVSDNASSLGDKNESLVTPLEMSAHELYDENDMIGEGEMKSSKEEARFSSDGKVIFEPNFEGEINQQNVDMGLLVLTRALLTVKSILDKKD